MAQLRNSIRRQLRKLLETESAATAVEYAIMLALILLACIIGITGFGTAQFDTWQRTVDTMTMYLP
jgi:Flp pilus assembly pilin Flp